MILVVLYVPLWLPIAWGAWRRWTRGHRTPGLPWTTAGAVVYLVAVAPAWRPTIMLSLAVVGVGLVWYGLLVDRYHRRPPVLRDRATHSLLYQQEASTGAWIAEEEQ